MITTFKYEYKGEWVFLYDLVPLDTLTLQKQSVREWRVFEKVIKAVGAKGWYCRINLDNVPMHQLILRLGGFPFRVGEESEMDVVIGKEFRNEQGKATD